ncbi:hypothetical protein [Pseudomonas sp. COR18]|uniref:hypothetical protein n=1 Tax=Pseudomonas sp. COR18 TaxID=3399680 RepID=UPI003B000186
MNTSDIALIDNPTPGTTLPSQNASLSGTGFPGAAVEIWQQNGSLLEQAQVDENSRWSVALTADLPLGPYTFSIRQLLGGVTSEWRNFSFSVTSPMFPVTQAPQINHPTGAVTSPFSIAGTATPGATVTVYRTGGGYIFGTVQVNANGEWSLNNITQDPGPDSISANQTLNGQTSGYTPNQPFEVLAAQSAVPVPQIDNPKGYVNTPFLISGTATPGATVTVYGTGGTYGSGTALVNASGYWEIANVTQYAGPDSITATQTLDGRQSSFAPIQSFRVDVNPPNFPITSAPVIDNPQGKAYSPFSIYGSATPGATVTVYRTGGGYIFGSATVGEDGHWILPNLELGPGTDSISANQTLYGITSDYAPNIPFTVYERRYFSKVLENVGDYVNSVVQRVKLDVDNVIGTISKFQSLAQSFTIPGSKVIGLAGEMTGVGLKIYTDIKEYGFVWNRQPDTTLQTGPGKIIEVPANTSVPQRARQQVVGGWIESFVPANSALPVPIPRPKDRWAFSKTDHCDAGGDPGRIPPGNFPYTGPGARIGQLLYKFGASGESRPIYNEGYANTLNDTGSLFLRINTPDNELRNNSGEMKIYIGMYLPSHKPLYVMVNANDAWANELITRKSGWDEYIPSSTSTPPPTALLALEAPAVAEQTASWNIYLAGANGEFVTQCGPAGVDSSIMNIEGDSRFPYSGPGARYGQLLYKWGENGTVLPVWNSKELGAETHSGNLLMRINDYDMTDNQYEIYVLAS